MYTTQRSVPMLSGRPRKKTIISSRDRASRQFPTTMKGRNLPKRVCVLSISEPQIGSVMPSNTRISGAKRLLKVLQRV